MQVYTTYYMASARIHRRVFSSRSIYRIRRLPSSYAYTYAAPSSSARSLSFPPFLPLGAGDGNRGAVLLLLLREARKRGFSLRALSKNCSTPSPATSGDDNCDNIDPGPEGARFYPSLSVNVTSRKVSRSREYPHNYDGRRERTRSR